MDTLYILMSSFFIILVVIIVLGAVKNCKDLVKVENEIKAESTMKKLTSNIIINMNEKFSQDPV
jgi:hypothetical protein